MYLTAARAWRLAVGAPLERGVRPRRFQREVPEAAAEIEDFAAQVGQGGDFEGVKRAFRRGQLPLELLVEESDACVGIHDGLALRQLL
jgi:hypothetical protein